MKTIKKLLCLLLIVLTLAGITGCGKVDSELLETLLNEAADLALDALESDGGETAPAPTSAPQPAETGKPTEVPQPTQTPAVTETPAAAEPTAEPTSAPDPTPEVPALAEDGSYTTKEDVALYIHLYGHLPSNFITKKEAEALGWSGGGLDRYAPGKCIGGSRFGNYEGLLPTKSGRSYTECDIDTLGASSRGAKRIVFSNDGLIYYTDDHYASFTLLYGEE